MIFRIARHAAVAAACAAMPGMAFAIQCDEPEEFDGRYYEVVAQNGIGWEAASNAAGGKVFKSVEGHLATITSEAEDVFLESLRQCARNRDPDPLTRPAVWVGGFQDPVDGGVGAGWQWVNGEGSFSPPTDPTDPVPYSNWQDGEPNDTGGDERYLTIGHTGDFGWNDERNLNNVGGYIIEYDTSTEVSVIQCTEGDGCVTTAGQTLLLPPVVNEDATIGIRTFEFTDNLSRCGKTGLVLFGDVRPELRIPPYLCGSPKFLVVEVATSDDFAIQQGTLLVENEPLEALPGNWYECDGLEVGTGAPLAAGDPQARDVVAWQATDPTTMRENGPLAGTIDSTFVGALGEYTFECGSSRGLTKTASYFVIGMHINFGEKFETSPDGVNERFVALTGYKLELLLESVEDSREALGNGDFKSLRALVRNAIRYHGRGDFDEALEKIEVFLQQVDRATYEPSDENYNGEHLARGKNIKFMYEEKVIPFAP